MVKHRNKTSLLLVPYKFVLNKTVYYILDNSPVGGDTRPVTDFIAGVPTRQRKFEMLSFQNNKLQFYITFEY